MCMDVIDFYLKNMMDREKYIMIKISMIPQEYVDKYNLKGKSHIGYIFSRVTKGMYGIPLARRIAYDTLVKHLEPYGCRLLIKTPGL